MVKKSNKTFSIKSHQIFPLLGIGAILVMVITIVIAMSKQPSQVRSSRAAYEDARCDPQIAKLEKAKYDDLVKQYSSCTKSFDAVKQRCSAYIQNECSPNEVSNYKTLLNEARLKPKAYTAASVKCYQDGLNTCTPHCLDLYSKMNLASADVYSSTQYLIDHCTNISQGSQPTPQNKLSCSSMGGLCFAECGQIYSTQADGKGTCANGLHCCVLPSPSIKDNWNGSNHYKDSNGDTQNGYQNPCINNGNCPGGNGGSHNAKAL